MNSSEGLRGFLTFLILLAILTTGMVGFNYVSKPTNTTSLADTPKTEPLNVNVIGITDSSAEITWTTVDPTDSKVIYSTNLRAQCLSSIEAETTSIEECQTIETSQTATSHSVKLAGLQPEATYFFRIQTNGKIYPTNSNHNFRTIAAAIEPASTPPSNTTDENSEFEGFGEVNTAEPEVNKVLGVSDENISEPLDPLGDIDKLMIEQFQEALTYNDLRYDFNQDGEVTMKDYPLFIEFAMNYEE